MRGEGGAPIQYLFRHFQHDPGVLQIEVVDRVLVDERISQGVVIHGSWTAQQAGLGLANLLRRGGIDAPVEAENPDGS